MEIEPWIACPKSWFWLKCTFLLYSIYLHRRVLFMHGRIFALQIIPTYHSPIHHSSIFTFNSSTCVLLNEKGTKSRNQMVIIHDNFLFVETPLTRIKNRHYLLGFNLNANFYVILKGVISYCCGGGITWFPITGQIQIWSI